MADAQPEGTPHLPVPREPLPPGLIPLVYDQLRRAADLELRAEPSGHTLQPTALVHEALLRLAGPRDIPWASRAHFYAAAAQAMRRILIDHARSKAARLARERANPAPAAPSAQPEALTDLAALARQDPHTILAVDRALSRLEAEAPEAAAIVRLRFFAGLTVEQAAMATQTSPRNAARQWALARALLHRFLSEQPAEPDHD